MSKRRAAFSEADIRRAIRAAKAEGFERIEVHSRDGLKIVCESHARPQVDVERVEELEI